MIGEMADKVGNRKVRLQGQGEAWGLGRGCSYDHEDRGLDKREMIGWSGGRSTVRFHSNKLTTLNAVEKQNE